MRHQGEKQKQQQQQKFFFSSLSMGSFEGGFAAAPSRLRRRRSAGINEYGYHQIRCSALIGYTWISLDRPTLLYSDTLKRHCRDLLRKTEAQVALLLLPYVVAVQRDREETSKGRCAENIYKDASCYFFFVWKDAFLCLCTETVLSLPLSRECSFYLSLCSYAFLYSHWHNLRAGFRRGDTYRDSGALKE